MLLCAQALLQREGNVDQLRVIQLELAEETQQFMDHIQRRDIYGPTIMVRDNADRCDSELPYYPSRWSAY